MDNLMLTWEEFRYLRKHKINFETQHQITMILPESVNNENSTSDILFATIFGEEPNIKMFKDTLKKKMEELKMRHSASVSTSSTAKDDVPLIVLSDSESDTPDTPITYNAASVALSQDQTPVSASGAKRKRKCRRGKRGGRKRKRSTSIAFQSSFSEPLFNLNNERKFSATISSPEEFLSKNCIPQLEETGRNKIFKPLQSKHISSASHFPLNITKETSSVSSTSEAPNDSIIIIEDMLVPPVETVSVGSNSGTPNDSIIILEDSPVKPVKDFIPINNYSRSNNMQVVAGSSRRVNETNTNYKNVANKKNESGEKNSTRTTEDADSGVILDDEIVVINQPVISNEVIVPRLLPNEVVVPRLLRNAPRILRPIVIDGSNVARVHGQSQNTYSCKGIQISVDYFLRRGHTEITVFVPQFRRHKTTGFCPTTDPVVLEEMAKIQRVVFTPSRNVNGRRLACYDDRFIVELAASNNGVILSNDNYRDLVNESTQFKKTIEERLLMFLFVGDKLMIPNDPMGRDGPRLDEFLSLPPNEDAPEHFVP